MIKTGIVGATGYGGAELVRLLALHPQARIEAVSSISFEGKKFSEVYPAFAGIVDNSLLAEADVVSKSDVVFAALPHGLSQPLAAACVKADKIFIDFGADFRIKDEATYKKWYGCAFDNARLHEQAVYGLPELFRDEIKPAKIIANPGCYPTGAALGLAPIVHKLAFLPNSIIIDAKSGVTGAGRTPSPLAHFPQLNENFHPYKVAAHRHTPEIEQTLRTLSGVDVNITFTPHLLPINRGILSTIYIDTAESISAEQLHSLFSDYYKDEKFVRILPLGKCAEIGNVRMSNYCDISLHIAPVPNRLIIVTAIDNMVKGAAGQAIQNMNIVSGLEENTGLLNPPPTF